MGAGQSTASQAPPRALHVLRVTPSSPASQTTIESFFDFVVGFQGDNFTSNNTVDAAQLEKIVESHEGRTLNLLIWNSKSQQTRGASSPLQHASVNAGLHDIAQWCPLYRQGIGHYRTLKFLIRKNQKRRLNHRCSASACACASPNSHSTMYGMCWTSSRAARRRVRGLYRTVTGLLDGLAVC